MLSRLKKWLPVHYWMRHAWEKRARQNPYHFIADFKEEWKDLDEFFKSGEDDTNTFLTKMGWTDLADKKLLEIGCGVGRMSRALASRFGAVTGVDISPTMIKRGQELNAQIANLTLSANSGKDLREYHAGEFDFVMSYIVFQHIPSQKVVYSYIDEALRVLKPGGCFGFQAQNDFSVKETDTYQGCSIELDEVRRIAKSRGMALLEVSGEGTQYCLMQIGSEHASPSD